MDKFAPDSSETTTTDSKPEILKNEKDNIKSEPAPAIVDESEDGFKGKASFYGCVIGTYLMVCAVFVYFEYDRTLSGDVARYNIVQTARNVVSRNYLGSVMQLACHAVDRQAKIQYNREIQSQTINDKVHSEQTHMDHVISEKSEIGTVSSTVTDQSADTHDVEAQGQPRKLRNWSKRQIVRKATMICMLMLQGLMFGPVVLHIVQRLFLQCYVEDIRTNIDTGSLKFWSFSLVALAGYGAVLDKRKQRKDKLIMQNLQQNTQASSQDFHDEKTGPHN